MFEIWSQESDPAVIRIKFDLIKRKVRCDSELRKSQNMTITTLARSKYKESVCENDYHYYTFPTMACVSYARRASISVETRPGTSFDNSPPTFTKACYFPFTRQKHLTNASNRLYRCHYLQNHKRSTLFTKHVIRASGLSRP